MKNPNRVAAGRKAATHSTPKTCRRCDKPYLGTGKQMYCSRGCKESASATKVDVPCKRCGKAVPNAGPGRTRAYCSAECKRRHLAGVDPKTIAADRICGFCGDPFNIRGVRGWRRKYCSEACRTRADSVAANAARNGSLADQSAALTAEIQRRQS